MFVGGSAVALVSSANGGSVSVWDAAYGTLQLHQSFVQSNISALPETLVWLQQGQEFMQCNYFISSFCVLKLSCQDSSSRKKKSSSSSASSSFSSVQLVPLPSDSPSADSTSVLLVLPNAIHTLELSVPGTAGLNVSYPPHPSCFLNLFSNSS